jgi:hypothetical protein
VETNAHLPRGVDGQSIQALRPDEDNVQQATIGASQQRITLPAETDVVEITVTADSRVKFGDSNVVADGNSRALLRGTYVYSTNSRMTHVAVRQLTNTDSGNCTATRLL